MLMYKYLDTEVIRTSSYELTWKYGLGREIQTFPSRIGNQILEQEPGLGFRYWSMALSPSFSSGTLNWALDS